MSFSDLRIKHIKTSADSLAVELMDGRGLTVPLSRGLRIDLYP